MQWNNHLPLIRRHISIWDIRVCCTAEPSLLLLLWHNSVRRSVDLSNAMCSMRFGSDCLHRMNANTLINKNKTSNRRSSQFTIFTMNNAKNIYRSPFFVGPSGWWTRPHAFFKQFGVGNGRTVCIIDDFLVIDVCVRLDAFMCDLLNAFAALRGAFGARDFPTKRQNWE